MKRQARITLKVAFIRPCIFLCLVDVYIQGRVGSRLTLFFDVTGISGLDVRTDAAAVLHSRGVRPVDAFQNVGPHRVSQPDGATFLEPTPDGNVGFAAREDRRQWRHQHRRPSPQYVKHLWYMLVVLVVYLPVPHYEKTCSYNLDC
jgi:hypothetical protein